MNQSATPAVAQSFGVETYEAQKAETAYVFYAMNLLDPMVRASVPALSDGGVVRANAQTLKYREGYLRQGEITQMRVAMDAQFRALVHPNAQPHMINAYKLTVDGETVSIGNRGYDDHLVFQKFYPQDEVDRIAGQNDGVVRMPDMSPQDALRCQRFLDEGIAQVDRSKAARVREHYSQRLTAARAMGDGLLADVCQKAILSVDQFEAAGRRAIAEANATLREAETKGWAWTYGSEAEIYFEALGIQRKDNQVQAQADRQDRLEAALMNLAASLTQRVAPLPAAVQEEAPKAPSLVTAEEEVGPEQITPPVEAAPVELKVGDIVQTVDGTEGQIEKFVAGKPMVRFADDTIKQFPRERVMLVYRPEVQG